MKIESLSVSEYRKFGLSFGAVIAFIFGVFFPWMFGVNIQLWPWIISGILIFWAIIAPATLKIIYYPKVKFGRIKQYWVVLLST